MDSYSSNPSVFNFYNYLRTHPLLVRQQLATTAADMSQTVLLSGFSHGAKVSVFRAQTRWLVGSTLAFLDCP